MWNMIFSLRMLLKYWTTKGSSIKYVSAFFQFPHAGFFTTIHRQGTFSPPPSTILSLWLLNRYQQKQVVDSTGAWVNVYPCDPHMCPINTPNDLWNFCFSEENFLNLCSFRPSCKTKFACRIRASRTRSTAWKLVVSLISILQLMNERFQL